MKNPSTSGTLVLSGLMTGESKLLGAGLPGGGAPGGRGNCRVPRLCLLSIRDEDMDGEWEAPQIPNPACETAPGCGTWKRPMIDNPNYKGKWKPPMIDNPNYQVGLLLPRVTSGKGGSVGGGS